MAIIRKKIGKYKMWLDPDDGGISRRLIATKGQREPAFQWVLKKEASGIAYDIGANIGYLALMLAKRCNFVYAFEPDIRSYRLLTHNKDSMENIECFREAITLPEINTVFLELNKKPNLSRINPNGICDDGVDGMYVHATSIDMVSVTLEKPNFVKLDVEGEEVNVLRGGYQTFETATNLKILIEVHPQYYNKDNDFAAVLRTMRDIGFDLKYIINAKGKKGVFQKNRMVKDFGKRAVFEGISFDVALPLICEMPSDGKKAVRAIMLEKK